MKNTIIIIFISCIIMIDISYSQKVSYFFTAEFVYQDLKIDHQEVTYTTIDEQKMNNENLMISQVPHWSIKDLVTYKAKLSLTELDMLTQHIHKFMTLTQSEYGDVPQGDRYYAYTIEVSYNNQHKKVIYKSAPNNKPCPEAFTTLQNFLLQLIKHKFEDNKK